MAMWPSNSSVTCLNCIVSSLGLARVISAAAGLIRTLPAIFDFSDGLVHGWRGTSACPIRRPNNKEMETLMSLSDLSGRVAVITGGNGGIGLGIAQALNAAGCNVSIWGRNVDKNNSAAATMASGPGKIDTRICDVSDPASVKEAMKATLDAFGRVDGCFANAGIGGGGRRAFIDRTE